MGIKEKILGAADRNGKEVQVKEWDTTVYVRTMTGTERDAFEGSILRDGKVSPDGLRAKLLVRCLADENGNRIFSDEEFEALGSKSAKVIDKLFAIAQKVNGIGQEDVDDLTKN
jgi:hypothetical protein